MSVPFSFDESAFEGGLADLLGDDEFGFGELSLLDGEPPSFLGRASFFGGPPPARTRAAQPTFAMSPPKRSTGTGKRACWNSIKTT